MAMEVATGAMGSLLPKLGQLLMDEYNLHKNVKKDIRFLQRELESMHAALLEVGEVPRDKLKKQVKLWAGEIRELSYKMEDVVDTFLVRVGAEPHADTDGFNLKELVKKMAGLFNKGKSQRQIANAIKEIKEQLREVSARRDRNKVDGIVANLPAAATIDPRLEAMYVDAAKLVGIYGKRDKDLLKLLFEGDDDVSTKKLKIVSIVGFAGLGKTTLAKAVYDKIKGDFDCQAFVPVGRNPDLKNVFRDILLDLDKKKYTNVNLTGLHERQLINELQEFLENKRYLIIIDDIWDEKMWERINLAFSNGNCQGSRLITTTRKVGVAEVCSPNNSVYRMEPLSPDDSEMLFYKRLFPHESGCPREFEQLSKEILKKCGGVPLAIITLASLLASGHYINSTDEWRILLRSIGRGLTQHHSLEEMQRILSFSYYDLPSHLKTCLLYLSIYPEDERIEKNQLIWKWVAEGFVQRQNHGTRLFELGETYFNELINRNMIQPLYSYNGELWGCHVHDMVLDLICSLSSEENFVTVINCTGDITPSLCSARRLSIQNGNGDSQTTLLINSASQVRSITMFQPAINLLPSLSGFHVLRVLDLMERHQLERTSYRLNVTDIGKLLHLRYLCLSYTGIDELPAEIGDLQFLEFLEVWVENDLKELPPAFGKLRRLMFLYIGGNGKCKMPPGMLEKLTSLEVLYGIRATTVNIVQELGNLSRLRELDIYFSDESNPELYEAFMKSLLRLHHMESLVGHGTITSPGGLMDLLEEQWVPSRRLRKYKLYNSRKLYTLPTWIKRDPSHLSNLSELWLRVKGLQQEDMQILEGLVALRNLVITCTRQTLRRLVIGADGFRRVVGFTLFCGSAAQIMFEPGALPRAELVSFSLGVRVAKDDGNGNFDLGLQGNLLSLRCYIYVTIYRVGATVGEAKEAEAAVRRALQDHPNHPSLHMVPAIPKDAHDDDICEEDEDEPEE